MQTACWKQTTSLQSGVARESVIGSPCVRADALDALSMTPCLLLSKPKHPAVSRENETRARVGVPSSWVRTHASPNRARPPATGEKSEKERKPQQLACEALEKVSGAPS